MTLIAHVARPFFIVIFLFASVTVLAQVRCATVEYENKRHERNPLLEKTEQFEKLLKAKMSLMQANHLLSGRTAAVTYTIPVVVHILHNGEPVGTGQNLSDAQIMSQIAAINRDFPRHNADSVNTPAEFQPVAGAINFNFVLAKQDPEGLPTSGITRTLSTKAQWTLEDDAVFKKLSYWPAEDYLNLWVINMVDPSGAIGYSQFPVMSGLPGLNDAGNMERLTDGVAFHYTCFGDGNWPTIDSHFNKGRTATHEIGHIFGLRHIWGDGTNCNSTDYCADTPVQDASTSGCPTHPQIACTTHKMFQNYMDYTDDACYNLFTKNQVSRMMTVLENSPRRASLLLSDGAKDPSLLSNNAGVRKVLLPDVTACANVSLTPTVQLRNYGNNNVTAVQIELKVNGNVVETKTFSLNLAFSDTTTVAFSPITLVPASSNPIAFTIISTNGVTDTDASNNVISQTVVVPVKVALPLVEAFNTTPANWRIVNPDNLTTWQNVTAPYTTSTNRAMYMNFFDYGGSTQVDKLITPVLDLSTATSATLKFDLAYALYSTAYPDQLRVVVSTSCDNYNTVEIFNKAGAALASVSAKTTTSFAPKSAADWSKQSISLAQFIGISNVQIQFIATNKNGNNLYLDNVAVITDNFSDIAINSLVSPAPVICTGNTTPVVNISNNGTAVITGFTVTEVINNTTTVTNTYTGVQLGLGEDQDFALAPWSLRDGLNTIKLTIQPSTNDDVVPINNVLTINEYVNNSRATVPLREDFDGNTTNWSAVSPTQQQNWITTSTNDASRVLSYEYKAITNTVIGSQAWLSSPVLDLSKVSKASMFFDLSYAKSTLGDDRLQVLGSTDCGLSYQKVLFNQTRDSLAFNIPAGLTNKSNSAWSPQTRNDWKRQYVNLDSIAGTTDARFAFVVTNGHGNNIFVDNIEIFVSDSEHPLAIEPLFAVYNNMHPDFKVTFNLPEKEEVRLQVINTMGQILIDDMLEDVLNQTFDFNLAGNSSGIYIVRLHIGNSIETAKVSISN